MSLNPSFHCKQTRRFFIVEASHDGSKLKLLHHVNFLIHLQVNCLYSRAIIKDLINKRPWCSILKNNLQIQKEENDSKTQIIQIGDFENIEWENVMNGSQSASSYLVRKGLSRKAQLALQIKRYLSKHNTSILLKSTPYTIILETWNAFDELKMDFGGYTFVEFESNQVLTVSLKQRLEWCLEDVKITMDKEDVKHWILKSSVTNKGNRCFLLIFLSWHLGQF